MKLVGQRHIDKIRTIPCPCGEDMIRLSSGAFVCTTCGRVYRWGDKRPDQRKLDRNNRKAAIKKYMEYGLDEHLAQCVATGIVDNCPICQRVQRLVLDHNHATGKARGLICNRCNILLGSATDSTDILHRAVIYLRKDIEGS